MGKRKGLIMEWSLEACGVFGWWNESGNCRCSQEGWMLGGLATSCGSWIRQLFLALSKGKAETGRASCGS